MSIKSKIGQTWKKWYTSVIINFKYYIVSKFVLYSIKDEKVVPNSKENVLWWGKNYKVANNSTNMSIY